MNTLKDDYKRHINYLRISITDRCNLRCTYCMPPDGMNLLAHHDILSYEEIVRIAQIAVNEGISKIRITGGEPLVRKGMVTLVHNLSQLDGIKDLSMTTNGILLSEYARPLVDAGLQRVNVSMDSLQPGLFKDITRGGDLSLVWKGIEKAQDAGLSPIKINVVAIQGFNDSEIIDFARLTIANDYQVRFIEFMPIGNGNGWHQEKYLSGLKIRTIIEEHHMLEPFLRNQEGMRGPAELYRLPGAQGMIGFINPISSHFCTTCNRLRLTADGKLRPCLFADQEIDILQPLRSAGTDEELKLLLHEALSSKPKGHTVMEPTFRKCTRDMVAIGG
jgi:cyclic pyranopterin phosphate synthase